jgi:predicted permease
MSLLSRLRGLWKRDQLERDIDDELRAHVAMRAEDNVRAGMPEREARYDARRRFGSSTLLKETTRERDLFRWLEIVAQDLRYGLRVLRKNPGFTTIAILTLALGIGANTAIFSLVDQILLRRLPVKDPQRLVLLDMVGRHYGNNSGGSVISYPMFRDFQDHNEVFSGMFGRRPASASLSFGGQAERVRVELVSGNYFSILGVSPAVGRTFTPDDDRVANGNPLVVLNYAFWQQRFAGDPNIAGKTLTLNNHTMTIIGVAQAGFDGIELGFSPKLFLPITMQPQIMTANSHLLTDRRTRWLNAFGRLKPGVTLEQAKASLQPFMHSILEMEVREAAFSRASAYDRAQFLKCWIDVLPASRGDSSTRTELTTPLWVLMATTGFVLLIACANIANLLLARATGRQKEIAVRLAIGASRARIMGQLLVESLTLSALGGLAGLALAFWADQALMAIYLPADSAGLNISTSPDLRILLFTIAVTIITGVVFGLAPALQSTKPDLARTLKDEAGSVVRGRRGGLRQALVVAQVALSLLLLVGAGLFLRTLNNLRGVSPGFPVERLVEFGLNPSLVGYKPEQAKIFYQRLTEKLSSIPGVQSVGLASVRILQGDEWDAGMSVEGYSPSKPEDHPQAYMNDVSPNYFATLGVPIVAGRDFTPQDNRQIDEGRDSDDWTPTVAIINETFARRYFRGQKPIGRHLGWGTDPGTKTNMEIIGIVKDIKYTGLRDDIPEQAFLPYLGKHFVGDMTVYLRTAADPSQLIPAAREKVRELDANLPVYAMRTTEEQVSDSLSTERMIASLSAVFGFLATLLATIGLYGVMAYAVARRTREIGIRMALGAEKRTVIWMVMREVLVLVAIGVAVGVPAAIVIARVSGHWISGMLFGLSATDPLTIGLAAFAMASVALLAGFLPARRASRVDPIVALRYE